MTERIVRFGPEDGLLGILTEPASPPTGPAVLFLNAGVLHHVGPFGWYVSLARRLAQSGFLSLRFDLSGIGDSPLRNDPGSSLDRALGDVGSALTFLAAKKQSRSFVAIGLCSGAVLAHHVALADPRVVGAVQLDGLGYTTHGYFLRHYAARAMRVKSWLGVGARLARKVTAGAAVDESPAPLSESFFFDFPPRDQVRAEIDQLLDRGTRLLYVYTGGVAEQYFNHRDQFEEMFGSVAHASDQLDVDYVADADHLYADHDHRQSLFTRIETWIKKFPH